jgi:hypothetical protein
MRVQCVQGEQQRVRRPVCRVVLQLPQHNGWFAMTLMPNIITLAAVVVFVFLRAYLA